MPIQSNLYDEDDTELYTTNLYSGTDTDLDGTERFTLDIDLEMNLGAEIDFKFLGSDSTDDLLLRLHKRRDATWTGNEDTWQDEITVTNDGTTTEYHFTIPPAWGPAHYRFGMLRSGSTTTFDIEVRMRAWREWDEAR